MLVNLKMLKRFAARCSVLWVLLGVQACTMMQTITPANGGSPTQAEATPPVPVEDNASSDPVDQAAAAQLAGGDHAAAAEAYLRAIPNATPERIAFYHLQAAELFFQHGDFSRARDIFRKIDTQYMTTVSRRVRYSALGARIALADGRPRDALKYIPNNLGILSAEQRLPLLSLRGQARLQTDDLVAGITDLLAHERGLTDTAAIRSNQETLWLQLLNANRQSLAKARQNVTDRLAAGWLDLAYIGQLEWEQSAQFEAKLARWRSLYSNHPAINTLYPRLLSGHQLKTTHPRDIALLLPLSGRYANVAAAVRDGFMATYYAFQSSNTPPTVRVYDTGEDATQTPQIYQQAIREGAGFVIGPLRKEALQQLLALPDLPVPVLSLNYLGEAGGSGIPNLYQFGLSPEMEAAAVAERALTDGRSSAVVFAPQGAWGDRMVKSFEAHFTSRGGQVAAIERYQSDKTDFSKPIQTVLQLDRSKARFTRLQRTLGRKMEFTPRRRNDAHFLFLAGFESQARLIRPQLLFHHARKLPVYSTSHVYSSKPDPGKDRDMNGIQFADMPWVLEPAGWHQPIRDTLAATWQARFARYSRLYALGVDAYRLIPLLRDSQTGLPWRFSGATGQLRLGAGNRVLRKPSWAKFIKGVPQPLENEPAPAFEEELDELEDDGPLVPLEPELPTATAPVADTPNNVALARPAR